MAAWCLPRSLSNAFLEALRTGELDPEKLMDMSSAERRAAFAPYVGEENAHEVNAQFESKLLLKAQKQGMVNWAKKVAGLSEAARRDILSTIEKLDKVLQPEDEQAFLEDLAAKKLGVSVTAEEAKQIFDLSKAASTAKTEMLADIGNIDKRIAYGRALMDLRDGVESMKPHGHSFMHGLIDVLNIPKSALTSILHFSAPFVQGWGMLSTKVAWQGFGQMFQYFADEENYKNLNAYIISHPDYGLAVDGKLGITKLGDKLSAREEAIQSTLVEQANTWLSEKTGVPNLVRASSRAFTGYLNYVRFNRFTQLLDAARLAGEDVRPGSTVVHDLAKVVNDFTGRGAIGVGDKYAEIAPVLNTVFFSPRKISATMQMFNPERYLNPKISPTARQAAIRQLAGSLIATGAVLAIAKAMGAEVHFDPRQQDFGKIGIGGVKLDMTGGNAGYLRLLAQVAANQELTAKGKEIDFGQGYKAPTRVSRMLDWSRGKLSPVAAFMVDALQGKDLIGRPFSLTDEMRDKLMPITMEAAMGFLMNDPGNTAAILPALSALFGVGLESPLPPLSKSGMDVWGQPYPWANRLAGGPPPNWREDPVNQEMQRIGYTPAFPSDTIRSVRLTPAQYESYVKNAGRLAHMRLSAMVQAPGWDSIPVGARVKAVRGVIRKARDMAATTIMLDSLGGSNDVMAKAAAAQRAKLAGTVAEAP